MQAAFDTWAVTPRKERPNIRRSRARYRAPDSRVASLLKVVVLNADWLCKAARQLSFSGRPFSDLSQCSNRIPIMPYTKQQAQIEIAHLVDTFQAGEARLRFEAEAQIENNYIRPLFRCLNWNTQNRGLAVPN